MRQRCRARRPSGRLDLEPLDRKVGAAAYLARHGFAIRFDERFARYCRSTGYSRQVHATNVELSLLQECLGMGGGPIDARRVAPDIAEFHDVLIR